MTFLRCALCTEAGASDNHTGDSAFIDHVAERYRYSTDETTLTVPLCSECHDRVDQAITLLEDAADADEKQVAAHRVERLAAELSMNVVTRATGTEADES